MNSPVTRRHRRTPWARRAVGVVVVVWLNFAILPCAMALSDMQNQGCPHYPAPQSAGESLGTLSEDSPCCDAEVSQCALIDDYNYDGRTVQFKVINLLGDGLCAAPPSAVAAPSVDQLAIFHGVDDTFRQPGSQPPLNVLYCVYLI